MLSVRKLVPVCSARTKGGVMSLAVLRGKLAAGVNAKVQVFKLDNSSGAPSSSASAADAAAAHSELVGTLSSPTPGRAPRPFSLLYLIYVCP